MVVEKGSYVSTPAEDPYRAIDAGKNKDGFVAAPVGISNPGAKNRCKVARALKHHDLQRSTACVDAHDLSQVDH